MNFVDEQNDVATSFDFFQNFFETLFKVTAVTATSNKRTEVERIELLVLQCLRNVVAHNFLSKAFNNCGLTNTRLTNEHRVVLGTT